MNEQQALAAFFLSKEVKRDFRLRMYHFPIPFNVASRVIAKDDLENMWAWILERIPPDSTPTGSVVQKIVRGEYVNEWHVGFKSEAFGHHAEASGYKICELEIDWFSSKWF